jgi:hypothetical protein
MVVIVKGAIHDLCHSTFGVAENDADAGDMRRAARNSWGGSGASDSAVPGSSRSCCAILICARVMAQEGLVVFRDHYASETNLSDLPRSHGPFHSLHLLRSGFGWRMSCNLSRDTPRNRISSYSRRFRLSIHLVYLHSAGTAAVH